MPDKDFKYESSREHTYESFKERQRIRALRAANTLEGSVNRQLPILLGDPNTPPKVIYLRDESGFGPEDIPVTFPANVQDGDSCCGIEPVEADVYEEARGG